MPRELRSLGVLVATVATLAVAPGQGMAGPVPVAVEPIFGINMSYYDERDALVTSEDTQRLFAGWDVPFVRVPLRDHFDNGPKLDDSDWLAAMNAVRRVGATPVLILRGPGSGRTTGDVLDTDRHLLDLVHEVFGDGPAYLEFGNEPDLAPVPVADYVAAWNAVIPDLKRRYPSSAYRFVGPVTSRVDHQYLNYLTAFVKGAQPKPDLLSWHEYLCDGNAEDWQRVCTPHLKNWQVHVDGVQKAVTDIVGRPMDYLVSEWNIDPNSQSPLYTDASRAAYLTTWTTTALNTFRALRPPPKGAMFYTATDNNMALVKGTTTLTTEGKAFHDAMRRRVVPRPRPRGDQGTTQRP